MMIPGIPVTIAPVTYAIGFILIPKSWTNAATVSPAAILPAIIEIINEGIDDNFKFLVLKEADSPYIPSSIAIITAIGNITGIPVSNPLIIGVIMPNKSAIIGDNKQPPNKTGICIGNTIGPVMPNM